MLKYNLTQVHCIIYKLKINIFIRWLHFESTAQKCVLNQPVFVYLENSFFINVFFHKTFVYKLESYFMYSQLPTNWERPREEKENFTLDKTFLACRIYERTMIDYFMRSYWQPLLTSSSRCVYYNLLLYIKYFNWIEITHWWEWK